MIQLVIVDDHQVLIDGMQVLLNDEPDLEVTGTCNSGEQLMRTLAMYPADVVLLDIQLPGEDGVEICKEVMTKYPHMKVIALTMYDEASFVSGMIQNGAAGYLLKNAGKAKVLEAVRAVFRGDHWFDPRLGDALLNSLISVTHKDPMIPAARLTRREKEIVELIAQGATTAEIGSKLFISTPTVESHRRNVLTKLNARNAAEMVRIVMEKKLLD